MRMSRSHRGDEDGLYGVHSIFGLIKNDRGGAFKNRVSYFHAVNAEFLERPTSVSRLWKAGKQCRNLA